MKKLRYDILSPDGFGMFREKTFASATEAEIGFQEWIKRYEHQGYYSSVRGRIPLNELRENCSLVSF